MIDMRRSMLLAIAQERKRAWTQQQTLRDQMLAHTEKWSAILDERDALLQELHELKVKIARASQQRAEVARLRAEAAFACLQEGTLH
jgi:hypothetical protein